MNIEIQELHPYARRVVVTLSEEDYKDEVEKELRKLRSNVQLKGFRQGKTPLSYIRRHMAPRTIVDVVNKRMNELLDKTIAEHEFKLIGEPVLGDTHIPVLEDNGVMYGEVSASFTLGLIPDSAIRGLDVDNTYDYLDVQISEDQVDRTMDSLRLRMGEDDHPDEVAAGDVLELEVNELTNGQQTNDGVQAVFKVSYDLIGDEELKVSLLHAKVGHTFECDIFQIERDRTHDYIKKYLLQLEDGDLDREVNSTFSGEVLSILRKKPATLDEDFFNKAFGDDPDIQDETTAKEAIRKHLYEADDPMAQQLLVADFMERVRSSNELDIAQDYLIALSKKYEAPDPNAFLEAYKPMLTNQLILGIVQEKLNLYIDDDDVRDELRRRINRMMYGGELPVEFVDQMVAKQLKDNPKMRDQIRDELFYSRMGQLLKDRLTLNKIEVSATELRERFDARFHTHEEEE